MEKSSFKNDCLCLIVVLAFSVVPRMSLATTFIVAASDASAASKASANYVCDGVNDQVEINTAFTTLPPEGGTVQLTEGTFNCATDSITPLANSIMIGRGETSTTIHYTNSHCYAFQPDVAPRFNGDIRLIYPNITVSDFKVTGTGFVRVSASHAKVHNITVTTNEAPANTVIGAFTTFADGADIEDIEYVNCKAIDPHGWGWYTDGTGAEGDRTVRNLRFTDCRATNYYGNVRYNAYDVGFDFQEFNNLDGLTVTRCYAEGWYQSGFHMDYRTNTYSKNATFVDCVSKNNGTGRNNNDYGAYWWGAGYVVRAANLINCVSENNYVGFFQYADGSFTNCSDTGSVRAMWLRAYNGQNGGINGMALNITGGNFQNNGAGISFATGSGINFPVTISNTVVSSPTKKTTRGISIDCYDGANVTVRDSQINNYDVGIYNWKTLSQANIRNVCVSGATTDFVNCNVISPCSSSTTSTPDTSPPSVPSGLTANAVSASQINLSWSASTDNVRVTGYKVYRHGAQIATTTNTGYSNAGLSSSTTYVYTVAAYDAAGNVSAQSNQVQATTQSLPTSTLGDISSPTSGVKDGKVDIYDVSYLLSKWGSTNSTDLASCDINPGPGNVSAGKIDIYDANLLMKNWRS